MDSTSRRPDNENCYLLKPYWAPLPFPSRAIPGEQIQEYKSCMEHIKALQVNIPFVETILQTPKYASLLKNLFTTKRNIEEVVEIVLNELPEKRGGPGSIIVPCQFGNIMSTRALTDSGAKSTLTLRVGDDSIIFKAEKKEKHKELKEDKVSSIILDDELLERELTYLQEINPNQFLVSLEENSDAKGDLEEIERLIKETDYKESLKSVEDSLTRRVVPAESTSIYEKSQSDENFSLQAISILCEPDAHVLHDYLENPLQENKAVKDLINFEDAHLSFLETIV
uniref:Aspartic peptidase DDI1-type domain-containing protein n=1 Tax=Lactuca sativa TaxID=4236 RepID=A0A9R1V9N1_LACSA|nr:hypothetical protein LSAT_V11C600305910 [Lactuca sativa]